MPSATQKQNKPTGQTRPPIVVILGHVDHGKTSILDYIRQTKVAEKESGDITQHIGAYQVEHQGKMITFLDTPGHEAFSAMRSRGAKVADLAVLVVAGDEGVKPQTKEAIEIALHQDLPLVVAINKMDKPNILPEKVKKELADNRVLLESLGGQIPSVFTSAKTGLGINDLLEMILLVAEMENLIGETSKPASGVIIESRMDAQRGVTATLLVREGTLKSQDVLAAESAFGVIKTMENFLGRPISVAPPSTPVLITGFDQVPPVGEEWQTMPSLEEASARVKIKREQEKHKRESATILEVGPEQRVFNLILKGDVYGSVEAIREMIQALPQSEIIFRIVKAEVGDIVENDVVMAESAKARIYGFRIKCPVSLAQLAQRRGVKIQTSDIIYELIQLIRQNASGLLTPEAIKQKVGQLKVLAIFKQNGRQQIIGGRVTNGRAEKGTAIDILREEEFLGHGKIIQLQQNKQNVGEMGKDREGGLLVESEIMIEKGDVLEIFKESEKKREL